MNRLLICVVVLDSLVSTISLAQTIDVDGGYAFVDENGKAVFVEARTGEKTILVDESFSKIGFGQDGTTVYIATGEPSYGDVSANYNSNLGSQRKLKVKNFLQIAKVKKTVRPEDGFRTKRNPKTVEVDFEIPNDMGNIQVSPDGNRFSWESQGYTFGCFTGNETGWGITVGNPGFQIHSGVTYMTPISHVTDLLFADTRARYSVNRTGSNGVWKSNFPYQSPGETDSPKSYPVQRFANRFAAIASCANGTVIEIHDESTGGSWYKGGRGIQPGEKPGIYEACIMADPERNVHDPTMVKALQDLVWLDYGLAGRFDNKLYLIMTNEEMESRIANSGVAKNPEFKAPRQSWKPIPTGWIWPVKPVLIETQNDSGNCEVSSRVQGIGQEGFAFRNGDGTLSLCRNGQVKKTEIKVSETWAWINPEQKRGEQKRG